MRYERFKYLLCAVLTIFTFGSCAKSEVPNPQRVNDYTATLSVRVGDYSGITRVEGDIYAVVSDKSDGIFYFSIPIDSTTGRIGKVTLTGVKMSGDTSRDGEGIVWCPSRNTFFISGEGDQRILEYTPEGKKTGAELAVPSEFALSKIAGNYGFEALGYNKHTGRFWTTTESTLPADGTPVSSSENRANLLRLQSFDSSLAAGRQYAYKTEVNTSVGVAAVYAFGVPEITALDDGRLLVLEREFWVGGGIAVTSSYVVNRIFLVDPTVSTPIDAQTVLNTLPDDRFMSKRLVKTLRTSLAEGNIANFEGMCLGPKRSDGRQTLLLINDSQSGYGGVLKEYVQLVTLDF